MRRGRCATPSLISTARAAGVSHQTGVSRHVDPDAISSAWGWPVSAAAGLAGCTAIQPSPPIAYEAAPAAVPAIYGADPGRALPHSRPAPLPGARPAVLASARAGPDWARLWATSWSIRTRNSSGSVEPGGTAMRYGIGVGRQGFEWAGDAYVAYTKAWPTWTPPAEMIAREPDLEKFSAANGGQPPGLDNALGAPCALSLPGRARHALPPARDETSRPRSAAPSRRAASASSTTT